ncbi:hypothetical protein MF672_007180 [Actinomadura sp. ATCC 31491]|uniref:Secreted protein n=1 Tax=Actinomadura luzonensis TaxID=2805427 RepID=A0ABT0FMR7_9ACTN|nr:hypothetical protein [Actinomadura luzonensis]MCK2213576.1 hypothetical protein [Actinomadura luzonensis]
MFSRTRRILGVALLALAAAIAAGAPASADEEITSDIQLPRELRFCTPGGLGLPMLDGLLGQVMGCGGPAARPASAGIPDRPMSAYEHQMWLEAAATADELPPRAGWSGAGTP